ncbi:hypothetical protein ACWEOH_17885 [Agromyces sp. NPDC004153]
MISDREAGGLLLAFLGAVILVLAVATMPLAPVDTTSTPTESTSMHGTPANTELDSTR